MNSQTLKILTKLSNLNIVKENIEYHYGHEDAFKVSIATGYPGIALLFYEAYLYTNDFKYYQWCNMYLKETIEIIEKDPMYSTSLFDGSMGVLFALATCSDDGKNYKNITSQILQEYENVFNSTYSDINNKIRKREFDKEEFDLIYGVSGTLLSLLHISDTYGSHINQNLNIWIRKLTNILETVLEEALNSINITNDNIFNDLGVSHGITGIINIVNAAFNRNFKSAKTYTLLEKSKDLLLNSIAHSEESYLIPNFLLDENLSHRDAWCYGTPGVSFVLYHLGVTLNNNQIMHISKKLAQETLKRPKSKRKLISPTICHGYSGLIIINKLLRNNLVEDYFRNEVDKVKDHKYKFMFKDIEYFENDYIKKDYVGLLEGSAGVLITLLSDKQFNSLWYKLFCFH